MKYRKYDKNTDKKAVFRIWNEVGWDSKENSYFQDEFIPKSRALVAELNGEAECLVLSTLGDYYYDDKKLCLSAVTGVTTSMVARKQKFALKLTAIKIAEDAIDGADVCGLGFFEQGFYNLLGFGNGAYVHFISFIPSNLNIKREIPVPVRLDLQHAKEIHQLRKNRLKVHGSAVLPEFVTEADLHQNKDFMGLGFRNDLGELTHCLWFFGKGKEHGPFKINLLYQNYEQFLDLLALIKSFGEQIFLVKIAQPAGIQFQDFLNRPLKYMAITEKSKYENKITASCWQQMRILNLNNCISKMKTYKNVRFNLILDDPIEKYLPHDFTWKGIGGKYIINLGENSFVATGTDNSLKTLTASVGAFSRLWSGVQTATSLSISDDLKAPQELLSILDKVITIPQPFFDWDF